jgi:MoxR-like ATPase
MFNQQTREFEFVEGPVFADVLLADEINRSTPRTQSALFEAMAERQVTIDSRCRRLPPTFFVIATQNPVESHGAYPLPEAQLDRFAMKLRIGYPGREHELAMLADDAHGQRDRSAVETVISPDQLNRLQQHVAQVGVGQNVREYLVDLGRATRVRNDVSLGLSPRGLLTWQRVAQAWAHLRGRDFVTPDDVQAVIRPVLDVRLAGDFESSSVVIDSILEAVPVPVTASKSTRS